MNTSKKFASQADLQDKQISFTKLSEHAYAYTAQGDPNSGIVIGEDAVLVDHCLPFDVTRCYDEARQFADPRIWTAERDRVMWETPEG